MAKEKDKLITGKELAERLNVNPSYITKQKKAGKLTGCIYNKKYYFKRSCLALGRDPDNPYTSRQSESQKDKNWNVTRGKKEVKEKVEELIEDLKPKEKPEPKKKIQKPPQEEPKSEDQSSEAKELLEQILTAIKDPSTTKDRATLDGLKQKASILTEYFKGETEEIKSRKLKENLFEKDEVIQTLAFAVNMVRNSLINLANNYAVSLEGLNQKEIKDFVQEDTNRILEDLQKVGEQFE